jgi:hypothetical protein
MATDPQVREELKAQLKVANKKARKATASLVTSAIFMACIAQAFRTLYNKDDEDDNIPLNMLVDAIGNLFGGLPIIKDIYARFAEGYDLDNYAYSAINDMLDSAEDIYDLAGDIAKGDVDSKTVAKDIKSLLYAAGTIFGIPVRNLYNITYGLTSRFSSSTAYKIDNLFYDQSYSSDLKKAVESGDDEMITTIAGIMLDENIGGVTDSSVRQELNTLIKSGYDVIPSSVGSSITYDGETYKLATSDKKQFNKIYSKANEALATLVDTAEYKSATDDVKVKSVNFIYNLYYNLAVQEYLGVDLENKNILFAEAIDIEKLALIISTAKTLSADTDKNGKTISGSKKTKIQKYVNSLNLTAAQKYMIMGYLGYTNVKGEAKVKAYINKLNLTKTEKNQLLSYSGYSSS